MSELYNRCQKIILDNYDDELNDSVLELLTVSLMALVLRNGDSASKFNDIFSSIKIFAEKKSVIEIINEHLNNACCDANENMGACVVRGYEKDETSGSVIEKKSLIVSLEQFDDKCVDVVEKMIHEFTHLLRDGGYSVSGKEIRLKNGMSTIRIIDYDKGSNQKIKHFYFEEGIVQRHAEQSFKMLYDFIKDDEFDENTLLWRIQNEYLSKSRSPYEIQVRAIDTLCEDEVFNQLIDESFNDFSTPSKVAVYYNNKMNSSTAFTSLSKEFDNCFNFAINGDVKSTQSSFKRIFSEIGKFKGNKVIRIAK